MKFKVWRWKLINAQSLGLDGEQVWDFCYLNWRAK